MAEPKIDALLLASVLDVLRGHPHGHDLASLAERFGLSTARMRSVIEFLWTVGVRDEQGFDDPSSMFDFDAEALDEDWVRLTHDPVRTAPTRFTSVEHAAVLTGLSVLRASANAEEAARIDALAAKLTGVTSETHESAPGAGRSVDRWLEPIRTALERGEQLRIHYRGEFADAGRWRQVDPLRLEVRGASTYLNAWCHEAREPRWFRTDRIRDLERTELPAGTHNESERARPLEVRKASGPEVDLAVAPSAIALIRPYLAGKPVPAPDADGMVRIRVKLRATGVAVRLAAEQAGAIIVEGPAEVRNEVAKWAEAALAALDDPAGDPEAAGSASAEPAPHPSA